MWIFFKKNAYIHNVSSEANSKMTSQKWDGKGCKSWNTRKSTTNHVFQTWQEVHSKLLQSEEEILLKEMTP